MGKRQRVSTGQRGPQRITTVEELRKMVNEESSQFELTPGTLVEFHHPFSLHSTLFKVRHVYPMDDPTRAGMVELWCNDCQHTVTVQRDRVKVIF